MICVTSHRPLHKCTPQIKENQLRAHRSWLAAFERIIYAGEYCEELSATSCEFAPAQDRPTIRSLCAIAASMGTWAAIVNSDIVITEKLKSVETRMTDQGMKCGISQRFDLATGFVIDQGLDFFCAVSEVWKAAYLKIPPDFRIGFGAWDNWMLGFFVCEYGRKCADLSREKLVYHPKHEDRKDPNWQGKGLEHKYVHQHFWPSTILR